MSHNCSKICVGHGGAAAAHQPAAASRKGNGQQIAGRVRRSSGDPQRALRGATAAAADAPAALQTLSRLQQLANASPQVAQLQRLQALANDRSAPVAQLAGGPEEEALQGKFATAQLQPQLQLQQAPRANNTGLPDQLKSGIESLSGLSLDQVRVHYNSPQPAQLNALAYAQGSDIHLAPGQERHLPHEAWHVVQQAQGRVKPTLQAKGVAINDDQGLEREADVMGSKTVQMMPRRDKKDDKDDKDQKTSPKPTKSNQGSGGARTATASPTSATFDSPKRVNPPASASAKARVPTCKYTGGNANEFRIHQYPGGFHLKPGVKRYNIVQDDKQYDGKYKDAIKALNTITGKRADRAKLMIEYIDAMKLMY